MSLEKLEYRNMIIEIDSCDLGVEFFNDHIENLPFKLVLPENSNRKFNLNNDETLQETLESLMEYNTGKDLVKAFEKHCKRKNLSVLPLYVYKHSDFHFSTGRQCSFDSSFIGFIVMSDDFNTENLNKELSLLSNIYNGYVYCYIIKEKCQCSCPYCTHAEIIDSCGGYFDIDEAIKAAKEAIDDKATIAEVKAVNS